MFLAHFVLNGTSAWGLRVKTNKWEDSKSIEHNIIVQAPTQDKAPQLDKKDEFVDKVSIESQQNNSSWTKAQEEGKRNARNTEDLNRNEVFDQMIHEHIDRDIFI